MEPEPEVIRPVPMRRTYCVYTHPDGERCWGLALKGKRLCYWHDPDTRRERETGGPPKSPLLLTHELSEEPGKDPSAPATSSEAQSLLRQIAKYLATTPLPDVGRAHALSTVALHLLKSETRRVERELKAVRAEITRLEAAQATAAAKAKEGANDEQP